MRKTSFTVLLVSLCFERCLFRKQRCKLERSVLMSTSSVSIAFARPVIKQCKWRQPLKKLNVSALQFGENHSLFDFFSLRIHIYNLKALGQVV